MKLALDHNFEDLRKYGFTKNVDGSSYDFITPEYTIFIWRDHHDGSYEYRKLYLEIVEKTMILENFDILKKLIIDHIIE